MNKIICKHHGLDCRYTEIKNNVDFSLVWEWADDEERNDIAKAVATMFKKRRITLSIEEDDIYIFDEPSEKQKLLDYFIAEYPEHFVV